MDEICELPIDHPIIRLLNRNPEHFEKKLYVVDKVLDGFESSDSALDCGVAINNTNELNSEIFITLVACLAYVEYISTMIIFPKDKNVLEFLSYLQVIYLEEPRLRTIIRPIILSKYSTKRRVMNIFNTYHPDDTNVEIDEFNLFITNTLQLRKFYTLEDFEGFHANIIIVVSKHKNLVHQLKNKKSSLARYNTKLKEKYGRYAPITHVSFQLDFPLWQQDDDDTETETESLI